ncbi:hypothetical protein GCM10009734_03610 [Nonomuraea bangladeshensis]
MRDNSGMILAVHEPAVQTSPSWFENQALARFAAANLRGDALQRFYEFSETWEEKYAAIVRVWETIWAEFVPFLAYDVKIRKMTCSTNTIESVTPASERLSEPAATSRTRLPP